MPNECRDSRFGLFGIIGHPLLHTGSPALYNAAFRHRRLPYVYVRLPVAPRHQRKIVTTLRLMDVLGANVTTPYKESIIDQLDALDQESRAIGAVNTIVFRRGIYQGFNTDGRGFLRSLARQKIPLKDRTVTMIGAGGAAAAIAYHLIRNPIAKLVILNRHPKRARSIADRWPSRKMEAAGLTAPILRHYLPRTDLLIYAVPIDLADLPLHLLRKSSIISDLRYLPNPLARWAHRQKQPYHNGFDMLIAQAGLSFHLFTGQRVSPHLLRRGILGRQRPAKMR